MSVSIPRPSIGRVVVFTDEEGDHPAIILAVCADDSRFGSVDLIAALCDQAGRHWRPRLRVSHAASGFKGSYWRYPDRVEGNVEVFHLDEVRTGQTFDGREVK